MLVIGSFSGAGKVSTSPAGVCCSVHEQPPQGLGDGGFTRCGGLHPRRAGRLGQLVVCMVVHAKYYG
ncbi:hypothetical protein E2C01_089208 [Portunus trituberculatus]|uniref:Uncharacterized protein n=1 Tax=Portunus trituberculatus TaxID=210409 RepID=A0A5B7JLL2_PORTR|nr:hypothetical protein [Portunus trituberculatus]